MNPYSDAGEAVYDESFDAADADFQIAAASLCDALRNETALVLEVELCFIAALRDWGEARSPLYGSFPFAPEATFLRVVSDFADENEEYRDVVGLALARDGDAPKLRLTHTRVLIKSTTPWNRPAREVAEAYAEWTAFLAAFNDRLDETRAWYQTPMPRARLTGEMFVRMATETAAVEGVRLSIGISAAFAVGSIVVFTGNVAVAILALVALVAVVATVLGIFTVAGWSLGIVEAVSITILVGLSCDFALHLAEAYGQSPFRGRAERGKDAVTRVGSPIVAAGTTTFAAVIPMLGCQIRILNKFGAIIPTCIVLSLFYSLHLFVPLLMIAGPDRGAEGPLRRLPEVLFRTQARRVAFFLCAGTALCLVIPSTLAVVAENFTVFAVAVLGLFAATGFWVYVENNAAERRDRRHGGAPEHARADRDEASQREKEIDAEAATPESRRRRSTANRTPIVPNRLRTVRTSRIVGSGTRRQWRRRLLRGIQRARGDESDESVRLGPVGGGRGGGGDRSRDEDGAATEVSVRGGGGGAACPGVLRARRAVARRRRGRAVRLGRPDATPQRLGRPAGAKGGWPRGWCREGDGRDQVASCVFKHERHEVTATTRAARRRIADGGYKRARCYENRRMRESEWRCCCELSKVSFVTSVFGVQIGVARVCVSRACASRALARDGRAGWCRTLRSGRARRCPRARRAAPRARPAGARFRRFRIPRKNARRHPSRALPLGVPRRRRRRRRAPREFHPARRRHPPRYGSLRRPTRRDPARGNPRQIARRTRVRRPAASKPGEQPRVVERAERSRRWIDERALLASHGVG